MKTMVLPEGLSEGRRLLQAACARPSALRSPKQAVKTYCRRTYEFNTYSLRYAFITHLLRLSHSPSIVAKIMGHSSLDHVLHYTEVKVAEEVLAGLRGREVIDIEASVGDMALYFILNGVRKVIALEPLPNVARCADENVRLSNATDKVKVINAALSDEPVSVPCDYDVLLSRYFSTLKGGGPCKVPGVTLGDLLNMVEDPYLLKVDCEGCEAQVILGPEREKLRAF